MGNSTHFMADWAPWEKRLVTTNFPASGFIGGPSLYLQQVQPRTTWRSFEMEYTTEKKTTTKHCYSHVYVPENATYNEVSGLKFILYTEGWDTRQQKLPQQSLGSRAKKFERENLSGTEAPQMGVSV